MNEIDVGIALHGPPHLREERLKDLVREAIIAERAACEQVAQIELDRVIKRMNETDGSQKMLVNQAWGMCADTSAIIRDAIRKRGEP